MNVRGFVTFWVSVTAVGIATWAFVVWTLVSLAEAQ